MAPPYTLTQAWASSLGWGMILILIEIDSQLQQIPFEIHSHCKSLSLRIVLILVEIHSHLGKWNKTGTTMGIRTNIEHMMIA